jgi:hypothetical protein
MYLKAKIVYVRINSYRYRHPTGTPAEILQWFALDPEPPSCCRDNVIPLYGEKPF